MNRTRTKALRVWRTIYNSISEEPTTSAKVKFTQVARGFTSQPKGVYSKNQWPDLPSALTAIIGKQQQYATKAWSHGFSQVQRLSRNYSPNINETSRTVVNRAYINILSSFSCAPKAQTVIRGLPLLISLAHPREAGCYSVNNLSKVRLSHDVEQDLWAGMDSNLRKIVVKARLAFRALFLACLFTPLAVTAPVALYFGIGRELWMKLLRKTIEVAGPAFMKWAQWASTRRDLFPQDFCAELSLLHSNVPPHAYRHTKKVLELAFSQPIEEMFECFEKEPCASGSIAQVHKAKLSPEGAESINMEAGVPVAVKVCHPNVEKILIEDFQLMLGAADLASHFNDSLFISESVRQFQGPLIEQVNLAREAEHLRRFNRNFRRHKDVSFPKPLYPYVSQDVLVETFEEGMSFQEMFQEDGPWNGRLAQLGLNAIFKMLLIDNFIHADLHPGNILISLKEPDFWAKMKAGFFGHDNAMPRPHITLLDTGMTTTLASADQDALFDFFESVGRLDGKDIAMNSLRMTSNGDSFESLDVFVKEVSDAFKIYQKHMDLYDDMPPAQECMYCVLDIFRKHKLGLKAELSVVVATLFMLEGWATKLDPDLKVMKTIRRFTSKEDSVAMDICTL